jgi:L-lysine 2,3-aminomutase
MPTEADTRAASAGQRGAPPLPHEAPPFEPGSSAALLVGRGYHDDAIQTVLDEDLLPLGLVRRLHTLFPQHSSLGPVAAPLFHDKNSYSGIEGFRAVCSVLEENGVSIGAHTERELFIDVYRFMVTRHTLNRIDWRNPEADPIFQLVFPQPGMIGRETVEAYQAATSREERERIAADYVRSTNPHDGKQLLNKPLLRRTGGELEVLEGSQHKYPQVQLIFDKTTQHCFSYCTYCFRHAQVRGDDDMFVQRDVGQVHDYLRAHPEVSDLLITGGDAGYMAPERFAEYVTPIIEDPSLMHVKTVRLGSRALSYEPGSILRPRYGAMLEQFDRLYREGIQLAYMAHFSTPRELLEPLTIAAIRRLQAHHVVIRSQSPIMNHISMFEGSDGHIDVDRSAQNWIDLGTILGMLSVGFHSIYCARPTGEHHYFAAPLAEVHQVFDQVYRELPSILRPSRHISMTTSAGKISILGTAQVAGKQVFALKFTEGRNMKWLDRVFLAKYDPHSKDVALLEPHEGDAFFFEDELREIEERLSDALVSLKRAQA